MTTVGAVLQDIVSGKSTQTMERRAQEGELGILKVSAVTWGEFRPHENKAMPLDYNPGACPRPMDGDILISRANTRELVGAPVMVRGDHPNLLLSDKLLKLIPNKALVDSRYLVRALRAPAASAHFFKCAGGSSGSMTNITQGDIRSAPIPLPPLPEQRRIAAILDQAETLRTQRRAALAQLDSLTQSLFLDMFGDPVTNPAKWTACTLGEVAKQKPNNGIFRKNPEYVQSGDDGLPVVWLDELFKGDTIDTQYSRRVVPTEKEVENYGLKTGDLLFCRSSLKLDGIAFNNVYVGPDNKALFECHLIRISPNTEKASPVFMNHQLRLPHMRAMIKTRAKTSTMTTIDQQGLCAVSVIVPPLPLQQTFATRVQAIEALKTQHRAALAAQDALFASLQQRAFAGTL
jgi:type I restriction enzyme S subunit